MTDLNVAVMKQALEILNQQRALVDELSPEQRAQIDLLPEVVDTLGQLAEVQITTKLGGFIDKATADRYHNQHDAWVRNLKLLPGLGPLLNFKPMGCSAQWIKELADRAGDTDFFQFSLARKDDKSMNYLVCVVDKDGNLLPGTARAVNHDYVDDMRPCPPCNT